MFAGASNDAVDAAQKTSICGTRLTNHFYTGVHEED